MWKVCAQALFDTMIGVRVWLTALVAASLIGRTSATNYPSDEAKAACDVWAEGQDTYQPNWRFYKWGCAKYISSGGSLTSCKAECASEYSIVR